jgi:cephalosporin hydroxylase
MVNSGNTAPRPSWAAPDDFTLDGLRFHCVSDPTIETTPDRIAVLKPRGMLDMQLALLDRLAPARILEFGIHQGGSALFLATAMPLERYVGIDIVGGRPIVTDIVKQRGLADRVALHFGISQDDAATVRGVVEREFGAQPLDLIIDDASHRYPQSRASFEATFGYLRRGGIYAVEDWGWSHWQGYTEPKAFRGKPALTNLLMEAMLSLASGSGAIAGVEIVNQSMAFITRGQGLKHGEHFDLSCSINQRRPFTLI